MPLPKLSSYALPWPTDWSAIFKRERPLILEIGFGYGQMLEYLHIHRPNHNIIGVEINNACLFRLEKMIVRKPMPNVRVVRSTAQTALHHLFKPHSLEEIHVNFPDPWFKERHATRRLIRRDTLDTMVSRLLPGGWLFLATDILAYAEMSAELLAETPGLTNQFDTAWGNYYQQRVQTKYEKKAHAVGRGCYYFVYQRNDVPGPEIPVIKELPTMPHVVIQTPLSLDAIYQQAELTQVRLEDINLKFIDKYRSERSLMFEVFVHEPTINQHVGLLVIQREQPDEFTIKMSTIGTPRPTDGLHKAVALLAELLVDLHPDALVLHNKTSAG